MGRSSELKTLENAEKVKGGPTNQLTDGQMDGQTDGWTDVMKFTPVSFGAAAQKGFTHDLMWYHTGEMRKEHKIGQVLS